MKKRIEKNNIIISAGINILIVVLAVFVFGVHYAVDDDLSMAYIAYGISMESSSRIVFSNVIFGEVLKTLFKICPYFNWQPILYYSGLYFSGFVAFYEVLKQKKIKLSCLWIFFVVCFFYPCFCELTFTTVAAYICANGLIGFFLSIEGKDKTYAILSGVIVFYASLIRFWSVMAISMFVFFVWILSFAYKYKQGMELRVLIKYYVVPFVVLYLSLGLGLGIDRLAYCPSEWKEYVEYNDLRSRILDNASIITYDDHAAQVELGITPEMALSLKCWKFNDSQVFNKKRFEEIDRVSDALKSKYISTPFTDTWHNIIVIAGSNYMIQAGLILLLFLSMACINKKYKLVFKVVCHFCALIPLFAQFFIYSYMGRYEDVLKKIFPPRIVTMTIMGFWLYMLLTECCFGDDRTDTKVVNIIRKACLIFMLGFLLLSQRPLQYQIDGFPTQKNMVESAFSFLKDGHIYVMDWSALQMFMLSYSCWQVPSDDYLHNVTLLGGCEINHPLLVEKERSLGISNPYQSLIENDNVYLVTASSPKIEHEYLKSVYGADVEFDVKGAALKLVIYDFDKF